MTTFSDGTRVEVTVDGDRILYLANGQREEHTKVSKLKVGVLYYVTYF